MRFKLPILESPITCNGFSGLDVPIPTLPETLRLLIERLSDTPPTPPIIALAGILLSGYCAYKLPQISTCPVNVGFANGAFDANVFVTVVEKLASSPRAAANSFNVSSAPGAPETRFVIAVLTNAVVANCVVFMPAPAVGAAGIQ